MGFAAELQSDWLDEFYEIVRREPEWLGGIVFGPQVRVSLKQLRQAIPARYPIRHYPDITHSRQCQYPVPDWDVAHAVTSSREAHQPPAAGPGRDLSPAAALHDRLSHLLRRAATTTSTRPSGAGWAGTRTPR